MPTSTNGQLEAPASSPGDRLAEKRNSNQSSLSSSTSQDGDLSLMSSNAADYDRIRNTTLMFFLDRLFIASKDRKEARTLHDLSCLFGTKDFTKEMRQIVGASRNGLKKFLQSYPSLFTIEDDRVYLTQLRQDEAAPARDYNREAVEYFTEKLQQFGPSLVPIKNLFGYRSQASQEVRHVSGKNTREFKQFLKNHEDVFEMLADENVILKSALKELEARGESQSSIRRVAASASLDQEEDSAVMDPYLNKQFASLIEESLKKILAAQGESGAASDDQDAGSPSQRRVTIEYLHQRILTECQNPLFLKMVRTIDEFKVFLRMHPKIFKRFKCDQDEHYYVTLMTEEERRELEHQAFPSSSINQFGGLSRQHSTLDRSNTISSDTQNDSSSACHQLFSLPPLHHLTLSEQRQSQQQQRYPPKTSTGGESAHQGTKQTTTIGHLQQSPDSKASAAASSGLRANAPPFVPSPRSALRATVSNQVPVSRQSSFVRERVGISQQPLLRSHSSLTDQTRAGAQNGTASNPRGAIDPRQAMRNHLMKASIENTSNGLYSPSKLANGAQYYSGANKQQANSNNSSLNNNNSTTMNNHHIQDDMRARTVDIVREASNIITRIMTTADAVAFDCKGYNLGFNGQITLIQLGFLPKQIQPSNPLAASNNEENRQMTSETQPYQKPDVCIFDLITNPELAYCLKPLLESDQIVKIVHDVRNKSNALHSQFGIMLNHVFDTQVANLVVQQQETGKPAYKSRYISKSKLCEVYGDESLNKHRNFIKSKTRHSGGAGTSSKVKDVNYWRTRPLTAPMINEATLDVYCLVGGIYQNLKSRIKPEYQPLFDQLNFEGVLARIKPDEIRSVKKERKIDLEVIELKRKLYSESTGAIVLSNREIRLLRHIDLTEEVRQKIQHCRKVAKKLERLDMKAALSQQSMQSMVSSDTDNPPGGDQSLDPNASINSNGYGSTSSSGGSLVNPAVGESSGQAQQTGEISDEIKVAELMDGSMFDEFKDKMIESSSLLESLEEDDDDDEAMHGIHGGERHHHHHHGHGTDHSSGGLSGGGDCCGCQCHRSSVSTNTEGEKDKTSLSVKSTHSTSTSMDDDRDSNGSKAVDMAIQCDLLS